MRTTHKLFLSGLVVAAGTLLAGHAQARDDVSWSVTIGTPGVVVPAPVYGVPAPVYRAPVPVVGVPVPVYHERHYDRGHDRYDDRYHDRHHDRNWRDSRWREPTRWDRDGDGVPNRYDRVYNPRWDRDGDGVPNRRDPHPNWNARNDWRHDGHHDRRDDRRW